MTNIKIGKKAKVCIKWNVQPINYTKESEHNIITKFAKKYKIEENQIIVQPNFITIDKNGKETTLVSDSVSSVMDPKFHHELYRQYMKNNNITDVSFDDIVKLDGQINTLIDYDSYEKSRQYKIKWVKWDNFLSFGPNNFIDLTTRHGLVQINGEPANMSGKSTFANDLFRFALFGKTKSGKATKFEHYFNNYRPDCNEVKVECCIEINGEDYVIKRILTRPEKGKKARQIDNKVYYAKILSNGEEEELADVNNLQGESSTKTNKIIKETIGSEEDFDLIVSANGKDLDELISLKETERGRLLSRWTGLSVLEDKENVSKDKWNKEISQHRVCGIYNRETLKHEIDELEKENTEYLNEIKKNETKIKNANEKIIKYKQERDKLLENKKLIDASLSNVDLHTVEETIKSITNNGKKKRAELEGTITRLNEIGNITFNEEKRNALHDKSVELAAKIGELRGIIKNLKKICTELEKAEVCPTCGKRMDNVDNGSLIMEKQNEIAEKTKEGLQLKQESDKVVSELNEIDSIYKLFKEKNTLEIKKTTLNYEIKKLGDDYRAKKKILDGLKENADTIKENNNIDNLVRVKDESIKVEEKISKESGENIVAYKKDIETNNKNISEKKSLISQIENELEVEKLWKVYLQMVGKDGISKMILNGILPRINGELNRLLGDIADFTVEVELNNKNDVDFWMVRDNTKTRLSASSGFERTMSALAIRFVLSQISNLSKPPFLLLDEILGGVAKENYDDIKKLYDKIVIAYDFVFHITHLNLEDWHDSIITIQKINDISSLKMDN